jgi:translation elongation factor EF-G
MAVLDLIEENDVDFVPIANKYLAQIKTAITKYKKEQNGKLLYSELLDELTQLRAQGSMFNYPSITIVTDVVVDLLESLNRVDDTIIEIVQAYEKSAMAILLSKAKQTSNPICKALVKELRLVCQKYKLKHSQA